MGHQVAECLSIDETKHASEPDVLDSLSIQFIIRCFASFKTNYCHLKIIAIQAQVAQKPVVLLALFGLRHTLTIIVFQLQ